MSPTKLPKMPHTRATAWLAKREGQPLLEGVEGHGHRPGQGGKTTNRPPGRPAGEAHGKAQGQKEGAARQEQAGQHQGAPGQLGGVETTGGDGSLQQLEGMPPVLQLTAPAGNHRHADRGA